MNDLEKAKAIADEIRDVAPEKAAAIDAAVAEYEEGRRESLSIDVTMVTTLRKYDGDYSPDKEPVETRIIR